MSYQLADSVKEARSLPAEHYTSRELFDQEVEQIFRREWFPVARIDQLESPGDYIVVDHFGDEIVVVRGQQQMNAFSNICLHRGCPLLEGTGNLNANHISCPYHKWAYELDGRLRGAPLMEQAEGFVATSEQLPQVALEIWQGWVFLNIDPNAEPLAPQLEVLNAKLTPFAFHELQLVETMHFDSPWNWKIMVENFMESYHHMGTHPETLNPAFPAQGTFAEPNDGKYLLLENPSIDETAIAPFWAGCILPVGLFALFRDQQAPYAFWYQLDVHSVDRFDLKIHILVPPALAKQKEVVEQIVAASTAIHLEDIPVCEGVWKGVNSRFYQPGRLSHLEACLWQFYGYLESQMGRS